MMNKLKPNKGQDTNDGLTKKSADVRSTSENIVS